MGPKKGAKVQSRWQPLPVDASIMQVMFVSDLDEHTFNPEMLPREELIHCSKFIDQSNKTLEVENSIIEKYLTRMDPSSLAKMNQILEAAAIALQKAERAAHLGGGTSTISIAKEGLGSRLTDDSVSSSSRAGTGKSSSSPAGKLGIFGLADKGPKVQAAQKLEIVNREIDELKNTLESARKKARNFNYILKCRNEEMSERLQEVMEAQNNFEQKLLVEGLDPLTGKLPGEKFTRYLETRLKAEEIEIDRMRIKTGSLKSHLKRVQQQLAQKEELGEVLHAVDFEQLQIENRDCQERLEEKIADVIDIKKVNGKYGTSLNIQKKKYQEQVNRLAELQQNAVLKEKMIKQLVLDEEKVNSEVNSAAKAVDNIIRLMKSYTVPDLFEYIMKKAELHDLKKDIKVCERQIKLKDLALASQVHKIKSMHEEFSKSQTFGGLTSPLFKESRIFF